MRTVESAVSIAGQSGPTGQRYRMGLEAVVSENPIGEEDHRLRIRKMSSMNEERAGRSGMWHWKVTLVWSNLACWMLVRRGYR